MTAATRTEAEAFDALEAFDSTLAHPWPDCTLPTTDSLDASLVDLPYSHLLLPSPPQSSLSPLLSAAMSHSHTRHARHSSLRTPLPAKRVLALPHSAASSTASATSTRSAPAALSGSPATRAARRSIGRATPPTVKLVASASSHHRRVSSFSPSALSPQAAADKQVGRTPRRRPVEANHRIASPLSTAPQISSAGSELLGATAARPLSHEPASAGEWDEQPMAALDAISDDDILGKLHQLLEEALVIQQAQGHVQGQPLELGPGTPTLQPSQGPPQPTEEQGQGQPQQLPPPARDRHRALADITNTTPDTRAVRTLVMARSAKQSTSAGSAKDSRQPLSRSQPKKSAVKKTAAPVSPAATIGAARTVASNTKRAILAAQPASPISQPLPVTPLPTAVTVPAPMTASKLSVRIRRFFRRVLALLRAIERLLSRRLTELRAEAVRAMKDSWCSATGIASCLEKLASTSSSLLHSVHAAIHTPIITLHYPEALAAFIPFFLSPNPPVSSTVSQPSPAMCVSPNSLLTSPQATIAAAAVTAATIAPPASHLPATATPPRPSPCATTPAHPTISPSLRVEPLISSTASPQQQVSACSPSSDAERAVLVSTIAQLQSFLAAQQVAGVSAQSSPLSALSAENRDLRSLIEAQEQQIARQQEMIAQARRQIEWQCQADVSQCDSACGGSDVGGGSEAMGVSLELSAISEAVTGSHSGGSSGSGSGCGNVSALMRAEWESGAQEVLSW